MGQILGWGVFFLQAFPPQGGRWPEGSDERADRGTPPNAPSSVSLRPTASPLEGEALHGGPVWDRPLRGCVERAGAVD